MKLDVLVYKFHPLKGGIQIKGRLPKKIQVKHAVRTIHCDDNLCFLYAVCVANYHNETGKHLKQNEYQSQVHKYVTYKHPTVMDQLQNEYSDYEMSLS